MQTHHDLLSPNILLSDILIFVEDQDMSMFSRGWYLSQIQQALEELSFEAFAYQKTTDIAFPENSLRINMPSGAIEIMEIYGYSGEPCNIQSMKNIYWKRRYQTLGNGMGFTSRNKSEIDDPFILGHESNNNEFWFNVINGVINFSESCSIFDYVRIVYRGVFADIGDTPFVPRMFRQAIIYWVAERVFQTLAVREESKHNKYVNMLKLVYEKLYNYRTGLWEEAQYRAKRIDSKMLSDIKEYLSTPNT